MKYDNKLNVVTYIAVTNSLVDSYFDASGKYQPHLGSLDAMRIYYNMCVLESKFDEKYPHNITDVLHLEEIISDPEFIEAFNNAVSESDPLSFGDMYSRAIDMVEDRKRSVERIITQITNGIEKLSDNLSLMLTDENLSKFKDIANAVSSGAFGEEKLAEVYGNSQRFLKVLDGKGE